MGMLKYQNVWMDERDMYTCTIHARSTDTSVKDQTALFVRIIKEGINILVRLDHIKLSSYPANRNLISEQGIRVQKSRPLFHNSPSGCVEDT